MRELAGVLESQISWLLIRMLIGTLHSRNANRNGEDSLSFVFDFVLHQVKKARDEVDLLHTHNCRNGKDY